MSNKGIKSIDIIIPVYNSLEYTDFCLKSVFDATKSWQNVRVIIVDDMSDCHVGDYLDLVANNNPNCTVLHNDENLGFIKTCNKGIAHSQADLVVLLNSDTLVPEFFVEKILDCFKSDSSIGVASPIATSSPYFYIDMLSGFTYFEMADFVSSLSDKKYPDIITPEGFCFCIKRDVINSQGVLDEIFGKGYYEESDYSMRAITNGWRTVCIDDLYVYHKRHVSFKDDVVEYKKNNSKIFQERWGDLYKKLYSKNMQIHPLEYLRNKVKKNAPIKNADYKKKNNFQKLREFYRRPKKIITAIKEQIRYLQTKKTLNYIFDDNAITFFLPEICFAGGSQSVINMANSLVMLGNKVRIVTSSKTDLSFQLLVEPIFVKSVGDFLSKTPKSKTFVATMWSTAYALNLLKNKFQDSIFTYFVQDFEQEFYAKGSFGYKYALASYDLIENKFAKTNHLVNCMKSIGKECFKINPGINLSIFYPLECHINPKPVVLAMSRPSSPLRRTDLLVDALKLVKAKHPEVEVKLFGEKPKDDDGLEYEFLGKIPHSQLVTHYRTADIYIDASDFHGFGRPGVEAMACGSALVTTRSGGPSEYVVDGENALFANTNDAEDIANKVISLVENHALLQKIKANALKHVQAYAENVPATQFLRWSGELSKNNNDESIAKFNMNSYKNWNEFIIAFNLKQNNLFFYYLFNLISLLPAFLFRAQIAHDCIKLRFLSLFVLKIK